MKKNKVDYHIAKIEYQLAKLEYLKNNININTKQAKQLRMFADALNKITSEVSHAKSAKSD